MGRLRNALQNLQDQQSTPTAEAVDSVAPSGPKAPEKAAPAANDPGKASRSERPAVPDAPASRPVGLRATMAYLNEKNAAESAATPKKDEPSPPVDRPQGAASHQEIHGQIDATMEYLASLAPPDKERSVRDKTPPASVENAVENVAPSATAPSEKRPPEPASPTAKPDAAEAPIAQTMDFPAKPRPSERPSEAISEKPAAPASQQPASRNPLSQTVNFSGEKPPADRPSLSQTLDFSEKAPASSEHRSPPRYEPPASQAKPERTANPNPAWPVAPPRSDATPAADNRRSPSPYASGNPYAPDLPPEEPSPVEQSPAALADPYRATSWHESRETSEPSAGASPAQLPASDPLAMTAPAVSSSPRRSTAEVLAALEDRVRDSSSGLPPKAAAPASDAPPAGDVPAGQVHASPVSGESRASDSPQADAPGVTQEAVIEEHTSSDLSDVAKFYGPPPSDRLSKSRPAPKSISDRIQEMADAKLASDKSDGIPTDADRSEKLSEALASSEPTEAPPTAPGPRNPMTESLLPPMSAPREPKAESNAVDPPTPVTEITGNPVKPSNRDAAVSLESATVKPAKVEGSPHQTSPGLPALEDLVEPTQQTTHPLKTRHATEFEKRVAERLADPYWGPQYGELADNIVGQFPENTAASLAIVTAGDPKKSAEACIYLGAVLAERKLGDVLLIDGNVLEKAVSELLEEKNMSGAVEVLNREHAWLDSIAPTSMDHFHLLPAGRGPITGLGSAGARLTALLRQAQQHYRFALVDGGGFENPLLPTIGRQCDATYFVVELGVANANATALQVSRMQAAGARVLGAIALDERPQ
ncbi:P-loop NTPase family protein [Lignipirellula cremea]|uniref:Tyrosine kinase n=1 Tax=Lignipirellula cremea TaxID=2528010 RepID=A0A518DTQ2_9BACT|nr:hypothetical protein [Lignipirellula cremea]QDU95216.1 tyrosine kinase [Lignipirellula cremea]